MIAVFAGSQEGRELIARLEELDVPIYASTATEYGKDLIAPYPQLHLHAGAKNQLEMENWLREIQAEIVLDATHPYAVEVSKNIQLACNSLDLLQVRFERPLLKVEGANRFPDYEACIEKLQASKGRILLTTGSNHLQDFVQHLDPDRLIVRVLPKSEVLKKCEGLGLKAWQVIAMQGPFSKAMNRAILQDYQICHLVTKETGRVGGQKEKIEAAIELGLDVYCIEREKTKIEKAWNSQVALINWIKKEVKKGREK